MENRIIKRRIPNQVIFKYIGVAILVVSFFGIGVLTGRLTNPSGSANNSTPSKQNFNLFWNVWNTLKSDYVDSSKVNEQEMYYGSIKGMVSALGDPATVYLDPTETTAFINGQEGKAFSGIGAELGYENGQVIVVAPLDGSPALKAGVKAGDVIVKVDDVAIKSTETIYDVVAKIRGEAGTTVKVTVLHKGATSVNEMSIVRGEVDVVSSEVKSVAGNPDIKLLRVTRFTDETVAAWDANWDKSVAQIGSAKGLIVDLRGNPGGFFDSAIYSAGEFFAKGVTLAKQENRQGKQEVFKSSRSGKLQSIPVVVLVDGGSASSSEIFAGALQQTKRATIIGEKTYGKGTAQSVIDLYDGSSLHITIAKWLLPNGNWINSDNPIKPDIEVIYTDKDFLAGNDVQMKKAIEVLNSKIK
ncbi:S41 family peptidase [Candidatus Dojkabacteria bacterium]|jgi:carboxyl-terminal processing protease|nr:S41 family peptidase [Candidatus Dojkabacteria bacterium]